MLGALCCDFCRFPLALGFGCVAVYGLISIGMVLARGLQASWDANPLNVITPFVLTLTAMAACWVIRALPSLRRQVAELEDGNKQFARQLVDLHAEVEKLSGSVSELERRNMELTLENERLEFQVGRYANLNAELEENVEGLRKGGEIMAQRVTDLQTENDRYKELNVELDRLNKELTLRTTQLLQYMKQIPEIGRNLLDKADVALQAHAGQEERLKELLHQLLVQRMNFLYDQACAERSAGMTAEEYQLFVADLDGELRARYRGMPEEQRAFARYTARAKDGTQRIGRETGFVRLRQAILDSTPQTGFAPSHVRPVRQTTGPQRLQRNDIAVYDDESPVDVEKEHLKQEIGVLKALNKTCTALSSDLRKRLTKREAENTHLRNVNNQVQESLSRINRTVTAALPPAETGKIQDTSLDAATVVSVTKRVADIQDVLVGAQTDELLFAFDQTAAVPSAGLDEVEFQALTSGLTSELRAKYAALPASLVVFSRFADKRTGRIPRTPNFRSFCDLLVHATPFSYAGGPQPLNRRNTLAPAHLPVDESARPTGGHWGPTSYPEPQRNTDVYIPMIQ
eukprot:TRINITY_DN23948_c0_g1_i1.p1 TRINITY_DN23948_c0_g1~~TRINITY_DN23948_c0_g1_i1.p1  ORF type:complete len:579 (+),score=129.87 TRINITY_DN23948_c0_g1_i1:24-1739(+)